MVDGLPHELTKESVLRLTDFIIQHHKNLRQPEFRLIGDRLMRKELYGKINLNTIVREIDKYWAERMEFAETFAIQEASQHKKVEVHVNVLKVFDEMTEAARLRKQKEKADQRAAEKESRDESTRIHNENIARLKREYGVDFKPEKSHNEHPYGEKKP